MRKQITEKLLKNLFYQTQKRAMFGCHEVTIGYSGNERVDFMTYDTKGIFRCYEIKSCKEDFYSDAKWSFVGHYNYFVLPDMELYEDVKEDVPKHIGVYVNNRLVKRAKRQELQVEEHILKDSMIRSLYRESEKLMKLENPKIIESYNRKIARLLKERDRLQNENIKLRNALFKQFGCKWRDLIDM